MRGQFPGAGFRGGPQVDSMWNTFDQARKTFERRMATRMGRGDVRAAIVALLAESPMHGYQLIREIEERTNGRWKPSAGSIYPTLQLLADEGIIQAHESDGRKTYSLTQSGRAEAEAADGLPWDEASPDFGPGSFGALPKSGVDLAQAVAQLRRTGSAEQIAQGVEILDDARRRIYAILAQE